MDATVQVALIAGSFSLLPLVAGELRQRKQSRHLAKQDQHLDQIRHQVQNSHDTNLREDVDRVLSGVDTLVDGQRRHSRELGDLRQDMRLERTERIAVADRLDDHLRHATA